MRILSSFVAAFCLVLVASQVAAAPPRIADPNELASIRTVGVISTIGDILKEDFSGVVRFMDKRDEVDISDWKIDVLVEEEVRRLYEGRLEFKTVAYDPALFRTRNTILGPNPADIVKVARKLPPADVDAYLIVSDSIDYAPKGEGQRRLTGLGLYSLREMVIADKETYGYAYYAISLVDARSRRIIVSIPATLDQRRPGLFSREQEPYAATWVLPLYGEMTEAQRAKARQTITELVTESLRMTLNSMGLAPERWGPTPSPSKP